MTAGLWVSLACNLLLAMGCVLTLGWGETYRVANLRLQERVRSLEDPDPLCGCGHHISFHNREDGCHYTVIHHHQGRRGVRSVLTNCACVSYVGPEPLPRIIDLPTRREEE
jgi:hypothetical protein